MTLFGFVFGLLIGGMMFVLIQDKAIIPFFALTITTIFVFILVDWNYDVLLQDWGITMKRKEKKTQ